MPFVPQRVFFEEDALDYPQGKRMWKLFKSNPRIIIRVLKNKQRIIGIPGSTPQEAYREGKRTLVVGIRKTLTFQTCKPSAHFQLPLVTGCMGQCEYCYLNTQFGKKPYIRVYVNLNEILEQTQLYINQRQPEITVFEGAATSDPVPVEPYTESLADTIKFFARQEYGIFRFVTKFTDIDSLLDIKHAGKTTIRFSINADNVIESYEHFTPPLMKRLQAAYKVSQAGYPLGFIVGPVILFTGWEEKYRQMFEKVRTFLAAKTDEITLEIISHRYTTRAKATISEVYPDSTLPMDESLRQFKFGQFGYGKYIYPQDQMGAINDFFTREIETFLPGARISYIV
ncbi:MAG: spore photoproduct lyase [Syntrophomonadaceae bacterium]|jgi:spore photoproduct lyase